MKKVAIFDAEEWGVGALLRVAEALLCIAGSEMLVKVLRLYIILLSFEDMMQRFLCHGVKRRCAIALLFCRSSISLSVIGDASALCHLSCRKSFGAGNEEE